MIFMAACRVGCDQHSRREKGAARFGGALRAQDFEALIRLQPYQWVFMQALTAFL
jgi:hypothetical protein